MVRRLISLLLCIVIVGSMAVGCSKRTAKDDVEQDPIGRIRGAFEKMQDARDEAYYDPTQTIKTAATSGLIELDITTLSGNIASYTMAQDVASQRYHTTYHNNLTSDQWQCILNDKGVFMVQLDKEGPWYGLQLGTDETAYTDTHLAEVLNWNDYKVYRQISGLYGDLVEDVIADPQHKTTNDKNAKNTILDVISEKKPVSVGDSSTTVRGAPQDVVLISYDISKDDAQKIYDAMFRFYQEPQTDHRSYLNNIFQDAVTQAGCNVFTQNTEKDTMSDRLGSAQYNVSRFYQATSKMTSLMISIGEDGELVDITMFASDNVLGGMMTLSFQWAVDDISQDGFQEDVNIKADCVNTSIDSFRIAYDRDIVSNSKQFSDTKILSHTGPNEILKTSDYLSYDKGEGSYICGTTYNDQTLEFQGTLKDSADSLHMTIDEVIAGQEVVDLDIEISADPYYTQNRNTPVYMDLKELSLEETYAFFTRFMSVMPKSIFGTWEPLMDVDSKYHEIFDTGYDYNKDGTVDERDKELYDHIQIILKAG